MHIRLANIKISQSFDTGPILIFREPSPLVIIGFRNCVVLNREQNMVGKNKKKDAVHYCLLLSQ